jgi:hypothetical protein
MKKVLGAIQATVTTAGGLTAKPLPVYANTAMYDGYTTVEDIYGENLKADEEEVRSETCHGFNWWV